MAAPVPCSHCGFNFMRRDLSPTAKKLCNNCLLKIKKGEKLSDITIRIECDKQTQIDIEEICLNNGIDFSQYFLRLHAENVAKCNEENQCCEKNSHENEEIPQKTTQNTKTKAKGARK